MYPIAVYPAVGYDDGMTSAGATATFRSADMASFIAALAGEAAGSSVNLSDNDLAVLGDLPKDNDGHYDGTYIWVGGTEYPVTR